MNDERATKMLDAYRQNVRPDQETHARMLKRVSLIPLFATLDVNQDPDSSVENHPSDDRFNEPQSQTSESGTTSGTATTAGGASSIGGLAAGVGIGLALSTAVGFFLYHGLNSSEPSSQQRSNAEKSSDEPSNSDNLGEPSFENGLVFGEQGGEGGGGGDERRNADPKAKALTQTIENKDLKCTELDGLMVCWEPEHPETICEYHRGRKGDCWDTQMGMAWNRRAPNHQLSALSSPIKDYLLVMVGCGYGVENDAISSEQCNPYLGDYYCTEEHPVLCIRPGVLPEVPEEIPYKYIGPNSGWSGGELAITKPVLGYSLRSVEHANVLCETQFGENWRMAEFHDGKLTRGYRGWTFWGLVRSEDTIPYSTGFWTHIDDQPANCWD